MKILCKHIYTNNSLQNIQTELIKNGIKNAAKPESKVGLLNAGPLS